MSPTVTFKDWFINFINKYFSYLRGKSIEYPNVSKSLLVHFVLIVMISGLLPTCHRKIEAPKIIAVDIMPMGPDQKTAPAAEPQKAEPKPQPKEEPKPTPPKEVKKPDDAAKMEKAEKVEPVQKPQDKPAPKKVEKKPEPEKEKKKVEEQKKKDEKDQEGKKKLLKDLEKKEQAQLDNIFDEAAKDEPKTQPAKTQNSGKTEVVDPAFVNEIMGKLQSQVSQCWNIPIGAKDVQSMKVNLFMALAPNGSVTQVKIIDQLQYTTDNVYRVVADSAVWAVKECSPFQGLPADKYELWKEIEFSFDPSQAL